MIIIEETSVLVVGGGPAGLITALQLARHGIKCILIERNNETTKWPKMDITNCRSMELFNRLGINQGLRSIGVPSNYSFDVIFSTGLSEEGEVISKWDLPSPDAWWQRINAENDGSMPREPYQRCSQAVFEAWLKPRIQEEPLIDSRFGIKLESVTEQSDGVVSHVINTNTQMRYDIKSKYLVGCDGAGSRVRKSLGIELIGGPVKSARLLVHFKSRDLSILHKQGQFWHIFFTSGSIIISQDEVDTWTIHLDIPLDVDLKDIDPHEAVYKALGGSGSPVPIKIDKILVVSAWRPNIAIAEKYMSPGRRVFLSGDAAHQNVPTGGYGMNTAVGDSFDIGWKLAAFLNGFGGKELLESYEIERQPIAIRNIERSGVHHSVHANYRNLVKELQPGLITSHTQDGEAIRQKIREHTLAHDGENKDHGIEMGYRYNNSPVIVQELQQEEPMSTYRDYTSSTWPGARAPHVFLKDNKTSIFDLFGPEYTIVDFTSDGAISSDFAKVAESLHVPLKRVHLPDEDHVRDVWGRRAVLVRPDDHVAWRASEDDAEVIDVQTILNMATGHVSSTRQLGDSDALRHVKEKGFSGTIGIQKHDQIESLADFQK